MIKRPLNPKDASEVFKFECIIDVSPPSESIFKANWALIEKFLNASYSSANLDEFCYTELYRIVEDICVDRFDKQLYEHLKQYYRAMFERELLGVLKRDQSEILNLLEALWLKIQTNQQLITEILIWFERTYLLKTRVKTIEKLILLEFHDQFEKIADIRETLIQQVIKQIMFERNGQQINRNQIKNIVEIFIKIEYYKPYFEPEFLKVSQNHYFAEAKNLSKKFEVSTYLNTTQLRINQEKERIQKYLEKSTEAKIVSMIEKLFIDDYLQQILTEGFDELVNNQKIENLQQLYTFLKKLDRIGYLRNTWQFYIKQKGSVIINVGEIGIEQILEFKQKLDQILKESFQDNYVLRTSLHYAFEDFLNIKTNKIAELTSKYFDNVLQKAHKMSMEEDSIEKCLDEALAIFRYLAAKDVFEAFYTKRLIKRLLLRNTSSFDLEKKMIEKFKAECGSQFTKKSEDIFHEFELSKSLTQEYIDSNHFNSIKAYTSTLELQINVFSTNSWPLKNQPVVKAPSPIDKIMKSYNSFYTGKFAGVVLFWQYDGSTCDVQGVYPKSNQTYIFQASLIQAIILTMFNSKSAITAQEIEQLMGVDPEELKLNLVGLYSPQSFKDKTDPILVKNPPDTKLSSDDIYTINDSFASKFKRIKVNQAQKKEAKEEIEMTTNRVLQERQYLLDACIVKIMKAKRSLTYNDLINEVFTTLKLPINVSVSSKFFDNIFLSCKLPEIKKRIESLAERDYIERDKDNMQLYHYVA